MNFTHRYRWVAVAIITASITACVSSRDKPHASAEQAKFRLTRAPDLKGVRPDLNKEEPESADAENDSSNIQTGMDILACQIGDAKQPGQRKDTPIRDVLPPEAPGVGRPVETLCERTRFSRRRAHGPFVTV